MSPLEKNATKLNADKTRFDPRPVGVRRAVRFRDCSRPHQAWYERTPFVPGCQYPLREFSKLAPRRRRSSDILLDTPARSATAVAPKRSATARKEPPPAPRFRAAFSATARAGSASGWESEIVGPEPAWEVGDSRLSPGVISGLRRYDPSRDGAPRRVSPKAERRQSRLASKPSAFCWLSASGIAPVRVWLTMNVHPACQNVNTLCADRRILVPSRRRAAT
jgi:hypothetical protein